MRFFRVALVAFVVVAGLIASPVAPVHAAGTTVISASGAVQAVGALIDGRVVGQAQSFQVSPGEFDHFTVTFAASAGNPVGDVIWDLCPDNGGLPELRNCIDGGRFAPKVNADNAIAAAWRPKLGPATYWLQFRAATRQQPGNNWRLQTSTADVYRFGTRAASVDAVWVVTGTDTNLTVTTVGHSKN
jgi:hypothetical protein